MYQNEMKEGFIQDYMRSRVVAKTSLYSLFRKVEPYEEKLKKDCSRFTKEEIVDMFAEFKAKSVYVLLNYNTILKSYCAWRKYYHDSQIEIAYEQINIELLKPCILESVSKLLTRDDITEMEDNLFNWTDRAIIEALWEGLSGNSMKDLVGVEMRMIDKANKKLHLPDGRIFDLTDRLCELLIKACEETEYICYGETLRVKKMVGFNKIYKERDNAHAEPSDDRFFRWIYRRIMNFRMHLGIQGLTMKNISTSGMAHYLRLGMEETGLELKEFLRTEDGQKLMEKYNYFSEFRTDNVVHKFKQLI